MTSNSPSSSKPEQIILYDGPSGRQIDQVSYVDAPQEGLSRQLDPNWYNALDNDESVTGQGGSILLRPVVSLLYYWGPLNDESNTVNIHDLQIFTRQPLL